MPAPQSKPSRRLRWILAVIVLIILALYFEIIPYGPNHMLQIRASRLQRNAKDWKLRGRPSDYGYTNETERTYVKTMPVPFPTSPTNGIMILESAPFPDRTFLLATETGQIYQNKNGVFTLIRD